MNNQAPQRPPELKQPPTVYQDVDGAVRLSPLAAGLSEGLELDELDRVQGFKGRSQRVVWQAHVTVPGGYRVELDALNDSPTAEAEAAVSVGERRVREKLLLSEGSELPSTTSLGVVSVAASGKIDVSLEMTNLPLVGRFALGELRLVPIATIDDPTDPFRSLETELEQ